MPNAIILCKMSWWRKLNLVKSKSWLSTNYDTRSPNLPPTNTGVDIYVCLYVGDNFHPQHLIIWYFVNKRMFSWKTSNEVYRQTK